MGKCLTREASVVFMINYTYCHVPLPPPYLPQQPYIDTGKATPPKSETAHWITAQIRELYWNCSELCLLPSRLQKPWMVLSSTWSEKWSGSLQKLNLGIWNGREFDTLESEAREPPYLLCGWLPNKRSFSGKMLSKTSHREGKNREKTEKSRR